MIRPKKVRPKIIRPKIIRPMDAIGLAGDSVLRDDPSKKSPSEDNTPEDNPTEDNPTDGCDWLSRCFRLKVPPKDALKPFMTRRPPCFLPDESDWTSGAPSLLGERDLIGPSDRMSCYGRF